MTAATVQIPQSTPPVPVRQRPAPAALRAFAALLVFPLVFPLAVLIWSAVLGGPWVGVLPAGRLAELAFNTLLLVVAVVGGSSAVGLATAWLTCRTNIPGRRIWSTLAALPLVIPSYVGALALLGATGRQGVLTELVAPPGLLAVAINSMPDGMTREPASCWEK